MTDTVEIEDISLEDSPPVPLDRNAPLHYALLVPGPGGQPVLHMVLVA